MGIKLFDDIIGDVFQKEFDIIFKQVAVELHSELTLDRLAECVYFNNNNDDGDDLECFDGTETIKGQDVEQENAEHQKQSTISFGMFFGYLNKNAKLSITIYKKIDLSLNAESNMAQFR